MEGLELDVIFRPAVMRGEKMKAIASRFLKVATRIEFDHVLVCARSRYARRREGFTALTGGGCREIQIGPMLGKKLVKNIKIEGQLLQFEWMRQRHMMILASSRSHCLEKIQLESSG